MLTADFSIRGVAEAEGVRSSRERRRFIVPPAGTAAAHADLGRLGAVHGPAAVHHRPRLLGPGRQGRDRAIQGQEFRAVAGQRRLLQGGGQATRQAGPVRLHRPGRPGPAHGRGGQGPRPDRARVAHRQGGGQPQGSARRRGLADPPVRRRRAEGARRSRPQTVQPPGRSANGQTRAAGRAPLRAARRPADAEPEPQRRRKAMGKVDGTDRLPRQAGAGRGGEAGA